MQYGVWFVRLLIRLRWGLSRLLGQRFEHALQRLVLVPLRQALGVHTGRPSTNTFSDRRVDFSPMNSVFLRTPLGLPEQRLYAGMLERELALAARYARRPQDLLVSVIMPSYNRAPVIPGAIASVVAQVYENWELLVIDDESQDDTADVVAGFDDPRIRYLRNDRRGGPARARNVGLAEARGTYIAYLDTDNTWSPFFLLVMINTLLDAPAFASAYCGQRIINRDADRQNSKLSSIRFAYYHHALVRNQNYIDLNVFVHHRSLYDSAGGFDESLQRFVDWDLVLKYTSLQIPLALPCVLNDYYIIAGSGRVTDTCNFWKNMDIIERKLSSRRLELPDAIASRKGMVLYSLTTPPRTATPRHVTVVIPSFNAFDCLQACVETLQRYTHEAYYDLVIVDNASGPAVVSYLRDLQDRGQARVVLNGNNMGFTYAVNQGIAEAAPDSDVVLLNNDAIVTEGWLEALSEVKQDIPAAGIIAPQQVLPPFTRTMAKHVPRCLDFIELDVTVSHHHNNLIDILLMPEKGFMELDFVNFFCVYITRTCLDAVGMLDHENGRHYLSDRLFCEAVRKHDAFKIVYTPHAKIYHLLQQSTAELKCGNPKEFETMFVKNEWDEQSRSAMQDDPLAKREEAG